MLMLRHLVNAKGQAMNNRFAVMGNPIAHSLSPQIHTYFAKQLGIELIYEKIGVPEADFEFQVAQFFRQKGKGLNITLPFKERAFSLASQRTARCQIAKAANTLWMNKGILHADNTDGAGLILDLHKHLVLKGKKILVIGAGGAARGIIGPLVENNAKLIVTNRSYEKLIALSDSFPQIKTIPLPCIEGCFDLIINATSASVTKGDLGLSSSILSPATLCYDLAYSLNQFFAE